MIVHDTNMTHTLIDRSNFIPLLSLIKAHPHFSSYYHIPGILCKGHFPSLPPSSSLPFCIVLLPKQQFPNVPKGATTMMMIMKQPPIFTLSFVLLFFLHCSRTSAQAPALAPAPAGPTNVTKILEKGGQFTLFIRLMKSTQLDNRLLSQLNDTNNGMTIFAPTDNAFSSLKSGTLNSLSDEEKAELVQFHIVPTYLTSSQFQTVSNPLRTQAGDPGDGKFPLNITTSGNSVNITTGLTNTSVSGTIYTDGQLAVYQVDQVLRPLQIFDPRPPAPAPAPAKSKKKKAAAVADSPEAPADNSKAVSFTMQNLVLFGVSANVVALWL